MSAAPQRAPDAERAVRPSGLRRLGMNGSLSPTSSPAANAASVFALAAERRNLSGDRRSGSRLRRAAWLTTPGGVKVRSPAKAPMPAARARVLLTLIVRLDADGAKAIQCEWVAAKVIPRGLGRNSGR